MRKPRKPKNYAFWITVLDNPKEVKAFEKKGNSRQKKALKQARKYRKWKDIQARKYEQAI